MIDLPGKWDELPARGATFSPCGAYRYLLWRKWNGNAPPANFVMLNPSTADAERNDPTVERCERRASMMRNCGGIIVTNIFAFRSTDPRALYNRFDPVGDDNDAAIEWASAQAGIIVCGWGSHGRLGLRGRQVLRLFHRRKLCPHAIRINADGEPAHPLYLPYSALPAPIPAA